MLALALLALAQEPDIVVYVMDDVSLNALEVNIDALPTLASIASDGFVFWNAHAMPLCGPSRRTLLTGTWDISGQLATICNTGDPMPLDALVLPEWFPGHTAGHFGKWHGGGHPSAGDWEDTPEAQGFEVARAWMPLNVENCGGDSYTTWKRVDDGVAALVISEYEPDSVMDEFEAFWGATASPKLALVSPQLAHKPFHRPPAAFLPSGYPTTPDAISKYVAMLVASDACLARVLAAIDLEETTLVIVGDNGSPTDIGGGKGTTLEGGTRVPLIFCGAGIPVGASTSIVSIADVLPTLVGEPAIGDGVSLAPLMQGTKTKAHDYILTGQAEDAQWPYDVACHGLRYVLRRTGEGEELYDLLVDPGQGTNLIGTPALATKEAAMRSWLEAHLP